MPSRKKVREKGHAVLAAPRWKPNSRPLGWLWRSQRLGPGLSETVSFTSWLFRPE